MRTAFFKGTFSIILLLALSLNASASSLAPDRLLGRAVDAFLSVGNRVGVSFAKPYRRVKDAEAQKRVNRALRILYGGISDKPVRIGAVIVEGRPGELNSFSTGSKIYISLGLVRVLDEPELIAVLAHELAHAEMHHLVALGTLPLGAAIYGIATRTGRSMNVRDVLDQARIGIELEADCVAAGWLEELSRQGVMVSPESLLTAMSVVLDRHPLQLPDSDPYYQSAVLIRSGSCPR